MAKYYTVPRFVKIQIVKDKDTKIGDDWVEVNKDGSEIVKNKVKTKEKNEKGETKVG